MHHSAIYDPRASATPSQAAAANQRAMRLRRIGSQARADTPIVIHRAIPASNLVEEETEAESVIDQEALLAAWVERQRIKHAEAIKKVEAVTADLASGKAPSVELIQTVVAVHYGVDRRGILSAVRTAKMVRPRQVAVYLAKTLTLRSLPDIGRRFGGRDHTTILHAVRKIADLIERDGDLAADVQSLKSKIEASLP